MNVVGTHWTASTPLRVSRSVMRPPLARHSTCTSSVTHQLSQGRAATTLLPPQTSSALWYVPVPSPQLAAFTNRASVGSPCHRPNRYEPGTMARCVQRRGQYHRLLRVRRDAAMAVCVPLAILTMTVLSSPGPTATSRMLPHRPTIPSLARKSSAAPSTRHPAATLTSGCACSKAHTIPRNAPLSV